MSDNPRHWWGMDCIPAHSGKVDNCGLHVVETVGVTNAHLYTVSIGLSRH